ncbi:MAG: TIGR00730 family Rossman fold protein [Oscillospiraceae bacterium]|jgi:uncharacterized protein (TIGR00730 family)|nr:TIGR00730 family Rossman fold protein [Oscillospiraceae bacterium]
MPNIVMNDSIKVALEYLLDSADYIADLAAGHKTIEHVDHGITVFGSARTKPSNPYYAEARKLGQLLARNGFTVTSGGGGGIMEAVNRGAFEAGGMSIGLGIKLPYEELPNVYTTTSHSFKYFFTRKQCLIDVAKAVICFPGGFGTLDELTEVITQVQTGKLAAMPLILVGKKFWTAWDEYSRNTLLDHGMVSEADCELYTIVDGAEEVMSCLTDWFEAHTSEVPAS